MPDFPGYPIIDNTQLYNGSISIVGAGTPILMTGYQCLSVQLSGVWAGSLHFETSNDNIEWDCILAMSKDDVALQDNIDSNGLYTIRSAGKYIRYVVEDLDKGPIQMVIIGKTTDTLSPADKLSFAMDKQLNMPLFTEVSNPGKRDTVGASIPSDAPDPILWTSASIVDKPITIDTTGYQTVIVHKITSGVVTPTVSNDGLNYVGTTAVTVTSATGKAATIPTAVGVYAIPVTARWLRLTGPASLVTCIIYLRQTPLDLTSLMLIPPYNMTQIVGATPAAAGVTPATVPILVAGQDSGSFRSTTVKTRVLRTDELGRLVPSNMPFSAAVQPFGSVIQLGPTDTSYQATTPAYIKDVEQVEGKSSIEILYKILVELKILNYQIHELPINLGTSLLESSDELSNIETQMLNDLQGS